MHNVFEGGRLRMLAYRLTDFLALRTTTVSEAVARHALEAKAVPSRKRVVLPNAINVSEFTPTQRADPKSEPNTQQTATSSGSLLVESFLPKASSIF